MNQSNPVAIDRNEELIKRGLERSCESLSFFLKEKVELETLKFSDVKVSDLQLVQEFSGKEIILYSEIFGQITGKCFFLLDVKEAELLFRKNFAGAANSMPEKLMFEAFLLELDNIITASVVTEFANHLGVTIYGGVPNIFYKEDDKVMAKADGSMHSINFKCRYKIHALEFSPMFFWLLDAKFLELISGQNR